MSATSAAVAIPLDENVLSNDWGVFFWNPPSWPSQWTSVRFTLDSQLYTCCEQAMMHRKALLFNDPDTARLILAATTPKEHKSLGRIVANFNPTTWDNHKNPIVYSINYAKFSQNERYAERLLATDERLLVEASPLDKVWGVGMSPKNCVEIQSQAQAERMWKGQNLLGKALMAVRSKLREERQLQAAKSALNEEKQKR